MSLRNLLVIVCSAVFLALGTARGQDSPSRIMTYNIRYDNPADSLDNWKYRKDFIVSMIRYHAPDVFGIQEGLINQVHDLADALKDYRWCGMGRDDGKEAGEFSAIFYNAKRYTRVADSTFWLSPTPDRPSKGWDAALNRIVTWVHLEERGAGTLYVFNTHFDHMGQTARLESARLLMKQIFRIANSYPAVVTGDFNSSDTEPPYAVLTAKDPQANLHLFDTQLLSPFHNGPIKTYSGFDVHKGIIGERIDFIFVCEGLKVLQHATLTDFRSNEHFPSDHLPVIADIASVTRH